MTLPQLVPYKAGTKDRFRPSDRDRIIVDGIDFQLKSSDSKGLMLVTETAPLRELFYTYEEYAKLRKDAIEVEEGYHEPGKARVRKLLRGKTEDDFDRSASDYADYKENLIKKYLAEDALHRINDRKLARSEEHLGPLLERWHYELRKDVTPGDRKRRCDVHKPENTPPTVRSFNNWYREYLKCGLDVAGLLPRYCGPQSKALDACTDSYNEWVKFADEFLDDKEPKRSTLYLQLEASVDLKNKERALNGQPLLTMPPKAFFNSLINRHGDYAIMAARKTKEAADRRFAPTYAPFRIYRPGQRIEIDCWKTDILTFTLKTGIYWQFNREQRKKIKKIRIWFIAAIDVATRCILGLKATRTPSSTVVVDVLRMVVTDKTELAKLVGASSEWFQRCRLERVYFDNGSEFANDLVHDVLKRMKVRGTHPPAGEPARRPFIETWFRTFGRYMLPYFNGLTFGSIAEKGDKDPNDTVILQADELAQIAVRVVCDIYHHMPHAGLAGNSPFNAWDEMSADAAPLDPPTGLELCKIFGTEHVRIVDSNGIRFAGIPYNCDKLQSFRRKSPGGRNGIEVRIRVDHENLEGLLYYYEGKWWPARNEIAIGETIGAGRPLTLKEWKAAIESLTTKNKTALQAGLPIVYSTVRDMRAIADAAREKAGLASPSMTPAMVDQFEQKHFKERWFHKPAAVPDVEDESSVEVGSSGRDSLIEGGVTRPGPKRDKPRKSENSAAPKASDTKPLFNKELKDEFDD